MEKKISGISLALRARIHPMVKTRSIAVDPEILSGTPCFSGTRVPVKSLFDYLARGRSIEYFLEQFPTVERQQVTDVLEEAGRVLTCESVSPLA
jgi:uncharacterized protein (DUF433 family)